MMSKEKLNKASVDVTQDNVAKLRELFPEAFTEQGVVLNRIGQLIGEPVDDGPENFGLCWVGKQNALQNALTTTTGTLRPDKERSVDWDTTRNVFIEGDNLEVLKLLLKSYAGKIKVIYIDPPYNTGNEFVYTDDFRDNLTSYLKYSGELQEDGRRSSSDAKLSGRYHTNWLNMMYPRLHLARKFLREDGIMFASIDHNESHHLRQLCDEIFGEENFVSELIWHLSSGTQAGHFTRAHETVLAFAKQKSTLPHFPDRTGGTIRHGALKRISRANPASEVTFKKGSITYEGGDGTLPDEIGGAEKQTVVKGKLHFKDGVLAEDVTLRAGWAMKNQLLSWLDDKETIDTKGQRIKKFYFKKNGILAYEKDRETFHPDTVLGKRYEIQSTKAGGEEVTSLFGAKVMDFPKPTSLVKFLVGLVCGEDDIVLDFFAGSGTTAVATMQLNDEDGGSRQYILVQLPEGRIHDSDNAVAGLDTIADIARERIRLTGEAMRATGKQRARDLGCRMFRLDSSNMKPWQFDEENMDGSLLEQVDHLVPGRTDEDLLYELILKQGVPLSAAVSTQPVGQQTIYCVGGGAMFLCWDELSSGEDAESVAQAIVDWYNNLQTTLDPVIVFRDSGVKDNTCMANALVILDQAGITDVRSL